MINWPLELEVVGLGGVVSEPVGISCPGTCTFSFEEGTTVTLTQAGAPFLGWSGDCASKGACAVEMTGARRVGAAFSTTLVRPPGTITVDLTVDDTVNKVFASGDLRWRGTFNWNPWSRIAVYNAKWAGPYPALYDDGPWNGMPQGHEPAGAVAGDHLFGATIFVTPPATGVTTFDYGVIDVTENEAWLWPTGPSSFVVSAGAEAKDVVAQGMAFPAFGTADVRVILDTRALQPGTWDTSSVKLNGSPLGWSSIELKDDGARGDLLAGDGLYTFQLSSVIGAGNQFPHHGLLGPGEFVHFRYLLGQADAREYGLSVPAAQAGISASARPAGAPAFTPVSVGVTDAGMPYFNVP